MARCGCGGRGWAWVLEYMAQFRVFQGRRVEGVSETGGEMGWKPPESPMYKLNTDAAVDKAAKASSFGAIIRNDRGEVMLTVMKKTPFLLDVDILEATVILESLILANEAGFMMLEVESDSARVISFLRSEASDISEVGVLTKEINRVARTFHHCLFRWCRRSANGVAHELARVAMVSDREGVWLEEVPFEVERVFSSELLDRPTVGVMS